MSRTHQFHLKIWADRTIGHKGDQIAETAQAKRLNAKYGQYADLPFDFTTLARTPQKSP